LQVEGGIPPYQYRWSNQGTALDSPRAEGLVEGIPYNVEVTDADGNTSGLLEYTVDTETVAETFNGTFAPIVASMGNVLFWDPVSALGIYDPVVYAEMKSVPAPQWSALVEGKFVLESWLKPEGTHVEEGEHI